MAKKSGGTMGMSGGFMAKKSKDMAPPKGSYGGMSTMPLGGGTEKPRRGYESSGVVFNGNCK